MPKCKLERRIEFTPAHDKRHKDPYKNYGIHGVSLRFELIGPKGAVQFVLFTNWMLPHVEEELDARLDREFPHLFCHPMPADLGYHSPVPLYEGQYFMADCHLLNGGCYYDGSGLNAEPVYQRLLKEGGDGIWKALEDYYRETFRRRRRNKKGGK